MEGNGVTRREFERLDMKVSRIDEGGTRKVGILEERQREMRDDVKDLRTKLDNNTRALWGLAVVLLVGTIGIISTLLTQTP
jgi:hypothetical protein